MRRRLRAVLFALLISGVLATAGLALSLGRPRPLSADVPGSVIASTVVAVPAVVTSESTSVRFPEGAMLLAVGTVLFALASAVRKTL
jgi:hypothetical protein